MNLRPNHFWPFFKRLARRIQHQQVKGDFLALIPHELLNSAGLSPFIGQIKYLGLLIIIFGEGNVELPCPLLPLTLDMPVGSAVFNAKYPEWLLLEGKLNITDAFFPSELFRGWAEILAE